MVWVRTAHCSRGPLPRLPSPSSPLLTNCHQCPLAPLSSNYAIPIISITYETFLVSIRDLHPQIAQRVNEILMPEDAANLRAFNAQLGLLLGQFPEWSEYARGIADRFGSDEAEQKAVSDASDAVQAMRNEAPDLLAPDAVDALTALKEDATPETDADGPGAFAPPASRRSHLRAARDLFLKLSDVVITPARKGVEKGIERYFEAMTAGALFAASTSLFALAAGLPAEFGWLSGIVTYLARILGI